MHFRQSEYRVVAPKRNLCKFGKAETKIHCALRPIPLSINCTSNRHTIQ